MIFSLCLHGDSEIAQHGVERRLAVSGLGALADDQGTGHPEFTRRKRLQTRTGDDDAASRNTTAHLHRRRTGDIQDDRRRREHDARADDRLLLDMHALDDDSAGTDEAAVFDDDWSRARRLQNTTDADTASKMNISADLRAAAHSRPGVHHRARTDVRTDVDEAGHQDDARLQKTTVTSDRRRNHANTALREIALERNLVVELKRIELVHHHLGDAEVEQDSLLDPSVDHSTFVGRLSHPQPPFVEHRNGGIHRHDILSVFEQLAIFVSRFDQPLQLLRTISFPHDTLSIFPFLDRWHIQRTGNRTRHHTTNFG